MTTPQPIVCTGRAFTDDGQPASEPCGRIFHQRCFTCRHWDSWIRTSHIASLGDQARAAGWRIGPNGDAMCPACAKPDPATLAAIRQL